jgi:hypothetical protein
MPGDQQLYSGTGIAVDAGSIINIPALSFARSSYLIAADALTTNAGTVPWLVVDLYWQDPVSGATIDHEQWVVTATTTSPAASVALVTGRGPSRSAQLAITLTNYDPAVNLAADLAVYQSTRGVSRADWRALGTGAQPYNTNAGANCPALIPGYKASASLASGANVQRSIGLYSGPATFAMQQSAGMELLWNIVSVQPQAVATTWPVIAGGVTSATVASWQVTLPRTPCIVIAENLGASATNVQWAVTALEQAS